MYLNYFANLMLLETPRVDLIRYFTLSRIASVLLIFAATWLLIRYSTKLLDLVSQRGPRARFAVKWMEPVLRIGLWFLAGFASFDLLAPSRETFLAAVGSVAIAIGLGAQDLIKNLVGGLVVVADRPYQLGDRVKIGPAYGEIDHIGLRSTKLTTPDDTRVTIPNSDILNSEVFNANSGVPDCQVVTDVMLPPRTDPALASRIGYEVAYTSPFTYLAKPVVVLVSDEFDRRPYMKVRIKAYVFDHRYEPRMQSDLTTRAKTEFLRLGLLDDWPGQNSPKPN
ncbi:MAG: mechanosensitive ion channel [Acidobacteria bacterium]|nr:mechanosensitive ion channel [Acidobacteriota bacterium]